jgi:glycosyltransferase involved in cell wall biosynthesis
MQQIQTPLNTQLPSFSLILETENLANADLKGLFKSLETLANQDISPTCANEVLLIDSGDTPTHILEHLCEQYPWIKVHHTQLATGYYKAKMLGAELVTGEIVVYFDSDCIYQPNWLRSILTAFTAGEDIQIVAGETMTLSKGAYGTAMALTYIFPQHSGHKTLTPTSQYFLNNVAFRREFLLSNPIPTDLPLYRGNCVIHARNLQNAGYIIWNQSQARATHAPPNGLSHFFWRFLLIGHDYYWQNRLLAKAKSVAQTRDLDPMTSFKGKLEVFSDRVKKMWANNPRQFIYLPLAIPIVISALALIFTGYVITVFQPKYLLEVYNDILGD